VASSGTGWDRHERRDVGACPASSLLPHHLFSFPARSLALPGVGGKPRVAARGRLPDRCAPAGRPLRPVSEYHNLLGSAG
jgi:hypothetical protein